MGTGIGFIFAAVVLVAMVVLFIRLVVKFRGERLVTCPETHRPVRTKIDAAMAAGTWIVAQPRFIVTACSRWPEHAGCDRACAPQIEASPEATLVRNIVARWYGERTCVYCARPIREIRGVVVPALLTPEGDLREWRDVAVEELPDILAVSVAVCATCELVEDFRRRFPHRIIERSSPPSPKPRRVVAGPSLAIY